MIAYVLGAYFDYYTSPCFAGALAALYGLIFLFFPETPLYLLKQNRIPVGWILILLEFYVAFILYFFASVFLEC